MIAIIAGLGHSLLSMSGFETLAQVYREIESPKLQNLKKASYLVCGYAVVCTGIITLFASMIIPDAERPRYFDNLISGLADHLVGPEPLKLVFHVFVVIVGGLILSGAVNTSIIGANGVLNRVAEDGVLLPWFRHPHHKWGTTHRMVNMIALLQIATIFYSRGNMAILAGAYAFGRRLELFLQVLGRYGATFPTWGSRIQGPAEPSDRRPRIPSGPDGHHCLSRDDRLGEPVHQAIGDQVRYRVHG
ncbi:MAG: amino acid permease [Acidobacteriota bacterium]